jgi:hypothetical protein
MSDKLQFVASLRSFQIASVASLIDKLKFVGQFGLSI